VRSKSSRTKAIKTKKEGGYFFLFIYSKWDPLDVTHRLARFQLFHGVWKVFCRNLVYLIGHGFLNLFNCIKSCTLQLQLHLWEQEVVGVRQIWQVWGGVSMLWLVFESETVDLLPNALGRCRAGGKNHECGTGRDELVKCAKLGGLTHLYNILH